MTSTYRNTTSSESHCTENSPTHSPIIVPPAKHCLSCALTCQIVFDYVRVNGWSMSIVRVEDDTFQTGTETRPSILRFYVNNYGARPFKDVSFNGNHYQLEFIEFYLPAVHEMPADQDDDANDDESDSSNNVEYELEMVLCHRIVDPEARATKWLNVSVFAEAQPSYSLTNTFFYQLINTVLVSANAQSTNIYNSSHLSNDSAEFMPHISWTKPVVNNSHQKAVDRAGSSTTNGSPAVSIDVGKNWTPYHALPANKAFYSYNGEFVYAPCKFSADDEVMWVIMQQPVSIHKSEYDVLRAVVASSDASHNFNYNNGTNYLAHSPAHGRNVMYNNGALVVGNQDQDKFIIKCVKASDRATPHRAYGSEAEEVQALQDQLSVDSKSAMHTIFQAPTSPISAIMFCLVISIVLFAIFASSNFAHQTLGEMANKKDDVQMGMIILVSIAMFVLYGMSFALASAVVGLQPIMVFVCAFVLMGWNATVTKFLVRKSTEYYVNANNEKYRIAYKILSWVIWIGAMVMVMMFIGLGFTLSFSPLYYLNGSVTPFYKHFFKTGSGDTETVYIGKQATLVLNFAGYRLNYYNEGSKRFDDNYMALPKEFLNLYGHLRVKTDVDGPDGKSSRIEKKQQTSEFFEDTLRLFECLEKYDTFMKRDHTKPLDCLVEAVKETLAETDRTQLESEAKKMDWYSSIASPDDKQSNVPASFTYVLDDVGAFKSSMRRINPDFYNFMLTATHP